MKIKFLAVTLCFFIIAALSISRSMNIPFERDEISWYFHTEFFDEAFVKKYFTSPLWYGYESFDHPQVSKYIYGAYLYLQDHNYSELRNNLKQKYGRWAFYTGIPSDEAIAQTEFLPIIKNLRTVNIICNLFILIEIYLLFYLIFKSYFFSLLASGLLATNPLFTNSTAVVTSDNHFLLFGLLSIYSYLRSITSKHLLWIFISAITVTLSTGSKLTGVFIFFSIILNECILLYILSTSFAATIKRVGIFITISFFFWIIINPALYLSPIQGSWRYFSFRNFQSANIAYHVPGAALNSVSDRAQAIVCTLIMHSCQSRFTNGSLTRSSIINILLLIVGFMYGFMKKGQKNIYFFYSLSIGYSIFFGYLASLYNYSDNYFILSQLIVFFIQMFGAWNLFYSLRGHHR